MTLVPCNDQMSDTLTIQDFKEGLEYIEGKTRITIRDSGNDIYIKLFPKYPDKRCEPIICILSVSIGRISFWDLYGNGAETEFQDQGYGTLIVNVAMEVAYWYVNYISQDIDYDVEWEAWGKVSNAGDESLSEKEQEICRQRRRYFWGKFGFVLDNPKAFVSYMRTPLYQLRILPQVSVRLSHFWRKSTPPLLIKYDYDLLMGLNEDDFLLQACPSETEINQQQNQVYYSGMALSNTLYTLLASAGAFFYFWIFDSTLNSPMFLSIGLGSFIFLFVFISLKGMSENWIKQCFWHHIPGYSKYKQMRQARDKALEDIEMRVYTNEVSVNGLIWRVYPALIRLDKNFANPCYKALYDASKSCHSMKSAFKRSTLSSSGCSAGPEHYRDFICLAKTALQSCGEIKENVWDLIFERK